MRGLPRLLLLLSAPLLLAGVLAGALPLSGTEPKGSFIECGAAVFGRPSPLPHPACAMAYFPLVQITWILISAGVVVGLAAGGMLIRGARRAGDAPRPHPAEESSAG